MRIAVAGLQHETNGFAPGTASLADFEAPGGWPRLARGATLRDVLPGTATPMAGALGVLAEAGAEIVPLLWALALPSGPVEHAAFEALTGEIADRLAQAHAEAPLDAVFLELHGAMVTTELEDGEGALLARVREIVGPAVPITASLDAHANVSPEMFALADHLDGYRTYPHIDMRETGARAARRLLVILARGRSYAKAYRPVPYLTSIVAQSTLDAPTARLVSQGVARVEDVAGGSLTQTFGFALADVADAGPAVLAYAETQDAADGLANETLAAWLQAEPEFGATLLAPADAVREASELAQRSDLHGPVVIADVQDNPGGGGAGDTTCLLRALLDADAAGTLHADALVVHVKDAAAVARAVAAGVLGAIDGPLGGRSDPEHGAPIEGAFTVAALGDGSFTGEGPMYAGNAIRLGDVALLTRGHVSVIVAGRAMQASEPALIRHLGLDPASVPILVLKSSVHFRGAYQDIARAILLALAPGRVTMDLAELAFRRATRRPAGTRSTTRSRDAQAA